MSSFKQSDKIKKLESNKKRTHSSRQWLLRQLNDPFVAKAKKEGYRSRAAFKFIEINEKYKLIKSGSRVLDLGAAPGGWCQVSKAIVGDKGFVVGVDLLEIEPITGVQFLQGNFHDEAMHTQILTLFQGQKADAILSDMAASSCGMSDVDHIRLIALLEAVFEFSFDLLRPGGSFVAKVLRGGTEHNLLSQLKQSFVKVSHFKPKSSRQESSELYVIAQGFRPKKTQLKADHLNSPLNNVELDNVERGQNDGAE